MIFASSPEDKHRSRRLKLQAYVRSLGEPLSPRLVLGGIEDCCDSQ
jgi:hypothetical protein